MANARTTDPMTSHEAAESVRESTITETQAFILEALEVRPRADHEIVNWWRSHIGWVASESGIRSRRAELVEMGKVVDSGQTTLTDSGRRAIVWELA